jgi:fucose permease
VLPFKARRPVVAATLPVALLALGTLGLRDGSLGVAWPSMRTTFHQPLSSLGVLLLLANAGYLVSSSTSGWASARVGAGSLLTAASVAAAAALAVYSLARWWPLLLIAAPVLGLANGVIDAGVNAHVALHLNVRAMGLVHASYGVGATIGPILVTALVGAGAGWHAAFAVLLALEAILAARLWATRPSWSTPAGGAGPGSAVLAGPRVGSDDVIAARALLPLSLAVFFVYTGAELATGAWAYSLLRIGRRLGADAAGAWVASYWAALTAGRLLLGLAGHRAGADRVLRASGAVTLAGALLLWWDPWRGVGAAGLPLLGLGLAAVFPTLVSLTPDRHGTGRAHAVIGYQLAAASVGGAALAALAGLVAGRLGTAALGPYLASTAAGLVVMMEVTAVVARRPKPRPGTML